MSFGEFYKQKMYLELYVIIFIEVKLHCFLVIGRKWKVFCYFVSLSYEISEMKFFANPFYYFLHKDE